MEKKVGAVSVSAVQAQQAGPRSMTTRSSLTSADAASRSPVTAAPCSASTRAAASEAAGPALSCRRNTSSGRASMSRFQSSTWASVSGASQHARSIGASAGVKRGAPARNGA